MALGRIVRTLSGIAAVAAATVAARGLARRHEVVSSVPAELRHPMLYGIFDISSPRALQVSRALMDAMGNASKPVEGVTVASRTVPGRDEHPSVEVRVYEPVGRTRPSGALLYIHGGGMITGNAAMSDEPCSRFAQELGILVVSVEYRLAPEDPFPAGLEDCYTVLSWMHDTADDLGIDPARVAVGGASAGGGLAASLTHAAHDRGGPAVAFQLLIYPMLDDRTVLRTELVDRNWLVWTPASNRFAWTSYVGHSPFADDDTEAAPARRDDLSGLPPAWIGVGDRDLFHDEDLEYAERLRAAGVACEHHVASGMYHGADEIVGDATTVVEFKRHMIDALRAAVTEAAAAP